MRAEVPLFPDASNPGGAAMAALVQAQTMAKLGTRVLCFFDVKNDSPPRLYKGQNRYQRVPAINQASFSMFLQASLPAMKEKRDFLLVLSGKLRSNEARVWINRKHLFLKQNKNMHDEGRPVSVQCTCSRQVHVEKELSKHKLHFKRITLLYDVPWPF